MKNTRIHFFNSDINIIGGVERVTETLSSEFIKSGATVTIHSLYSQSTTKPTVSKISIIHYSLTPPDLEKNVIGKVCRVLINGFKILFKNRNIRGYCIFQGFYIGIYRPFVASINTNHIICEHNTHAAPSKISQWARKILYRTFPSQIVVLSEADKNYYRALGLKNVFKIYNPTPQVSFKKTNFRNRTLISIGRFTAQKRFDLMIRICSKILLKYPDWQLVIQGDGEDRYLLNQEITKLQNTHQFQIIQMGSPNELYARGDIFLMTSLYEGLPMTIIEAMSFGIPAIAMNCSSGLRELIENEQTGFLTPMDSIESFIEKVSLLIEDEELRKKLSEGAQLSSKKFLSESIVSEWEKIIK